MDDSVTFPLPITVSSPPDDSTIVGAINTINTDQLWDQFNKFYNKNEKAIEKCMKTDVRSIALGEKASDIELQIDAFSETTKVVLDGLAGLGKIHPIIGAAVVAFHAVISLDLSRRDNDRKVIAIMLEMQNMMCGMFELRHLKYTNVQESERDTEKSRLHRLIESITADIIQCGSDLNYYLGQKFAFKLIKAKNFEQRFKMHVENFATRRSELQSTIAVYIAGGVDQANLTITEVSKKLDDMDSKLDYFFYSFLRKLDTPQEREAFRFFDQNNGVDNCISKDDLLARLLTMTGDVLSDSDSKAGLKTDERIKKSRKVLTDEVHQNFEESLKQNTLRFERLLTIQNNNHERVIAQLEKQEGYQKVTVSKLDKLLYYMHPDTKLNDPEVRRIWERMGLKTSVKAKNFVLTFRDHYQHDHSAPPTPNPLTGVSHTPVVEGNTEAQFLSLSTNFDQPSPASPSEDPNAWLLEYIDVAHVRPIVEAMDADGSGFISVKEINTFARARPKEWSLLQWMVYWAAGWHINITKYRDKIYDILVQMHELLPSLHPANRVYVDEYLDGYTMETIESILRSTKSVTDGQHSQIAELAQVYADAQEAALRTNLEEVSYVISSVADATLVAGPARAESWIYPLLYLLLERHFAVLKLGRTLVFNQSEINTHWLTLHFVLEVFKQRKESLTAIFSQIYQNVAGRFETFAYGMFYAFYKEETEVKPAKNTLAQMRTKRSTRELFLEMRYRTEEAAVSLDTSILALEKGAPFEFEDLNVYESTSVMADPDRVPHPVEGYWSVICYDSDGFFPTLGLFHFVLSIAPDGSITGSGESYVGQLKLTGTSVSSGEGLPISIELKMVADNEAFDYIFHGTHNSERDTATGTWEKVERAQESPPEASTEDTADEGYEGVFDEVAQDTWPGQGAIAPNDGDSDLTGASESPEADVVTSAVNVPQAIVPAVSTDEATVSDAPSAEDGTKTPTQIDAAAEDNQNSNTAENIVDDKQQLASNDPSAPDGTSPAAENDQPREMTNASEGSDDLIWEEEDNPKAKPAQDPQASDDAAESPGGAVSTEVIQDTEPDQDAYNGDGDSIDASKPSDAPSEVEQNASEASIAANTDAVVAQEGVSDTIIPDTLPVHNPRVPSDGDSAIIDTSKSTEASEAIGDMDAQRTSVACPITGEVAIGDEPDEHADTKPPGQANAGVEDKQQSNPGDSLFLEENQRQKTTNLAQELNNEKSMEDGNPNLSEFAKDPQIPDEVAEETEGVQGTDDSDVNKEESPKLLNTFSMRRIPAHIRRFRPSHTGDSLPDSSAMAKNRWKFAIEATKYQVQVKNMPWEYVRARFAERRLWLDLSVSFWQNLLPPDRVDLMCNLTLEYGPSQSRLYETIANFLNDRGYPFKTGRGITCDYCGLVIVCDRYRCITCMKEDLSNQIDLCSDTTKCIENASSNTQHDFVHTPSHTLLRQKFWLHKIHLSSFIPQCRTRSENIKKRFRTLEENKKIAKKIAKASKSGKSGHTSQVEQVSDVQPLICVCCEKEASLPCWVCATCVADTAVCMECELKRAKIVKYEDRDSMHSHDHLLLRISDSVEVQSREVNNVRLQRELINITTDLRSLEQKVTTHLRAASKVNTALKRFTADGEVKIATEKSTNGAYSANGETASLSAQHPVNDDDDDDDMSDIFGSVYSSDTESEALASATHTPRPAEPQPLPAEIEATGTDSECDSAPSEIKASPESTPEVIVWVTSHVEGALMDTPTPTNAQFFETFTAEPETSLPQNGADSPTQTTENVNSPKVEADTEAAAVEPPTQTSKSRRLTNHLMSIDTRMSSLDTQMTSLDSRISSLDTRISSVDTRISSLDNRLSGVETQLGEILSLLRQSRS
ncbi:hypothetical protein D9619_010003 [Psilocybe cf. subviscida]|uniref:EF-hand domain-containing protein n=1 Tax=Psilocybe cf. subviscida TaxID=2480587 RepID=A0A8H5BLF9_9AGAR|nr:hypothetical protein D9619_010003 [Psilocybe cf. subviscida]